MVYYSGTSRFSYEVKQRLDKKLDRKANLISCWDSKEGGAFGAAFDFANKRARQDSSLPVVIEIVREEDFKVVYDGYPVLVGRLTEENHRIYEGEELESKYQDYLRRGLRD